MTRTELLKIGRLVATVPVDAYKTPDGQGFIYTSVYLKRPINVYISSDNSILAIAYNRVCYYLNPSDRLTAPKLRAFYEDHNCCTKVFLYAEAKRLFCDEDGENDNSIDKRIAHALDYADMIPIPYVRA